MDNLLRKVSLSRLLKHGDRHNEKTHGNWARGGAKLTTGAPDYTPLEDAGKRKRQKVADILSDRAKKVGRIPGGFSLTSAFDKKALSDDGYTVFHGTSVGNAAKIRSGGLEANVNVRNARWFMVTTSRSSAQRFSNGGAVVEFVIPLENLSETLWAGKPDAFDDDSWQHALRADRLDPKHIRLAKHAVHNQKSHGNWARGTSARQAGERIKSEGGFTLDYIAGDHPTTGWAVAISGNEKVLSNADQFLADGGQDRLGREMRKFITGNSDTLNQEGWFWGAWFDKGTNRIVFDTSRVMEDRNEARKFMLDNDQDAMFNLGTGKEISNPTKGR